ncbi:MAG: hypothetical protein JWR32_5384 [Mycobacterium sp.]|jgi:hypothetical protein|nr:hypothetical protein [Mycobacterium sp.]
MAALHRRAVEGGSYQVKLSLARSAMWVEELGLLDVAAQGDLSETDSYPLGVPGRSRGCRDDGGGPNGTSAIPGVVFS